jgi:chlorosome envelope protein H
MAEDLNKPAGSPKPAVQKSSDSNVGNGDMANLIGNMGVLIDSTIESVQGIITTVSSATGQIIEGVTSTINSEPVQGIINNVNSVSGKLINNVNSVSGQLIDGVTATLNSEQVQSSFQELGKMWKGLLVNLNSTVSSVSSGQVQNLFDNVSSGLGQLVGNVMSTARVSGNEDRQKKEVKEIPFSQKEVAAPVKSAAPVATPPVAAPVAAAPVVKPKI